MIISLICFSSKESETDSEGIEVDIMTPLKDELRPKKNGNVKRNWLSISVKNPKLQKKHLQVVNTNPIDNYVMNTDK